MSYSSARASQLTQCGFTTPEQMFPASLRKIAHLRGSILPSLKSVLALILMAVQNDSIYALGHKVTGSSIVNGQVVHSYSSELYLFAFHHGLLGDMNMDGVVNQDDVPLYNDALTDPSVYQRLADMNQNGIVSNSDTGLFMAAVNGGSLMAVPEPGTGVLLVLAGVAFGGYARRWPVLNPCAANEKDIPNPTVASIVYL
jgi:hypothetical protein